MNYVPAKLFQLGNEISDIRWYLSAWENGILGWNATLLQMRKRIIQRCIELNDQWELRVELKGLMFDVKPSIYHSSPDDEGILVWQENMIRDIVTCSDIYLDLVTKAKRKLSEDTLNQAMYLIDKYEKAEDV